MTKVSICITTLAFTCTIGCRIAESTYWESMPKIRSTSFIGASNVWIVTVRGELLFTTNQGRTWERPRKNAVGKFKALSFVDVQHGWAINDRNQIWSSHDGGYSWGQVAELPQRGAERIKFIDQLHGWAIEPFFLCSTVDGGVSWQVYYPLANTGRIEEPTHTSYFLNDKLAWLGGERGAVYRSSDGGKSWKGQKVIPENADISAIHFIDERTGWFCSRPRSAIYRTADGGISWHEQHLPSGQLDLSSIQFVDQNNGWAVGSKRDAGISGNPSSRGQMLRTSDGGRTWQALQATPNEILFLGVHFADLQNGWLLGRDNLHSTSDGGRTWSTVLKVE